MNDNPGNPAANRDLAPAQATAAFQSEAYSPFLNPLKNINSGVGPASDLLRSLVIPSIYPHSEPESKIPSPGLKPDIKPDIKPGRFSPIDDDGDGRYDFDDPGFRECQYTNKQYGIFLRAVLDGTPYHTARARAGMPRDIDPGFSGGEGALERDAKLEARLLQNIANGMKYDSARSAAGYPPSIDPGMEVRSPGFEKLMRRKAAECGFEPQSTIPSQFTFRKLPYTYR